MRFPEYVKLHLYLTLAWFIRVGVLLLITFALRMVVPSGYMIFLVFVALYAFLELGMMIEDLGAARRSYWLLSRPEELLSDKKLLSQGDD